MDTFIWDHNFETGIATIDEQHHRLVDLINAFGALIGLGDAVNPSLLEKVYSELAGYAHHHFREEEFLMEQVGIDQRHQEPHRMQHASFLKEVAGIRLEAGDQFVAGAGPLLKFLTHWLAYHILGIDQFLARQITAIRGGVDPATAFWSSPKLRTARNVRVRGLGLGKKVDSVC